MIEYIRTGSGRRTYPKSSMSTRNLRRYDIYPWASHTPPSFPQLALAPCRMRNTYDIVLQKGSGVWGSSGMLVQDQGESYADPSLRLIYEMVV